MAYVKKVSVFIILQNNFQFQRHQQRGSYARVKSKSAKSKFLLVYQNMQFNFLHPEVLTRGNARVFPYQHTPALIYEPQHAPKF